MAWNQAAFGRRLKALREQTGLSMLAFGKEIGTSASRIKHWEEGKSAPSASWIVTICERFDVSAERLLTGSEKVEHESEPPQPSGLFGSKEEANLDVLADSFIQVGKKMYGDQNGREKMIEELTGRIPELSDRNLQELLLLTLLKERIG